MAVKSSPLNRGARAAAAALLILFFVLPMVAVVLYSFATSWTSRALPDGYTLDHWINGLQNTRLLLAMARTFVLAIVVTILDLLLVIPAVYWQKVRNPRIRTAAELCAAIPFVLPFIVIAFGILRFAGQTVPYALGSPLLLMVGHAAIAFPFLYWAVEGAMSAADILSTNEAALMCGASPAQSLWLVVLPQIKPGIASGAMLVFAVSFGEFALAQVLVGARFENLSLFSLDLLAKDNADYGLLAVLTTISFLVLTVISTVVVLLNRDNLNRTAVAAR